MKMDISSLRKKKKCSVEEFVFVFQKMCFITVIEKDQGKDFALFLFNMVCVVCLTALVGN